MSPRDKRYRLCSIAEECKSFCERNSQIYLHLYNVGYEHRLNGQRIIQEPLVRVSFHDYVFIPRTINGTVFAAVLSRKFKYYNSILYTLITSNPWEGSASTIACLYLTR